VEGTVRFEEGERFSARELIDLMSVHVYARKGNLVPEGTQGTITNPKQLGGRWLLVVEWHDGREEMFTKRDATKLLRF